MTNVTDHNEFLLLRISFFLSRFWIQFRISNANIQLQKYFPWAKLGLVTGNHTHTKKWAPESKTTSQPCEIKMPPVLPPKKPARKWSDQDSGAYEVPVASTWTCPPSTSSTEVDPELRHGRAKRFQVR